MEDRRRLIANLSKNRNTKTSLISYITTKRQETIILIKEYYRSVYGLSLDEAFSRNDIPNYQSIERKARLLKAVNHSLRVDKNDEVDKYRTISTEIPVAVTLF